MDKLAIVVILMAIGLTSCNRQQTHPANADPVVAGEIAKIRELSAVRAKAFNEGNADIIAAAFTETGLLMAPGSKSKIGRDAVREYYRQIFDQYVTVLESGYEEVKVSGDLAYGVGFAKVKLVPHTGGDTLLSTAKYINILQRQNDGSWLTTHDIWNSNEE